MQGIIPFIFEYITRRRKAGPQNSQTRENAFTNVITTLDILHHKYVRILSSGNKDRAVRETCYLFQSESEYTVGFAPIKTLFHFLYFHFHLIF